LGKVLHLREPDADFVVTGVVANLPANSHLNFDMVARVEWLGKERLARWNEWVAPAYLLLNKRAAVNTIGFDKKMTDLLHRNLQQSRGVEPVLQPLAKVHLYEEGRPGRVIQVYIFSMIAIFILVMACINFMNLSTARSINRANEVGMRKVVGAIRSQLIKQFLGEAMLFSLLAMFLAIILVMGLFPVFTKLTNQKILLSFKTIINILPVLFLTTLITGFIAGSYPALFLSSFKPVQTLKNRLTNPPEPGKPD